MGEPGGVIRPCDGWKVGAEVDEEDLEARDLVLRQERREATCRALPQRPDDDDDGEVRARGG